MTKLCPRGKAAAKRKFRVYPSAYANAYASKICAGKIKDPSGVKRKDFKGRKPAAEGGKITKLLQKITPEQSKKMMEDPSRKKRLKDLIKKRKDSKQEALDKLKKELGMKAGGRAMRAGGGLMEATQRLRRQGLKAGGRGCKLAMKGRGRAYGKNS